MNIKSKLNSEQRIRYAIYTRISSEMQNEQTLETQERLCREEIAKRGGYVAEVFADRAQSGWKADRPDFVRMKLAAKHDKFDAIMVWKFDRLSRDTEYTMTVKTLFRKRYNISLHCVEGVSIDDDDSPIAQLTEKILDVVAGFYSLNLRQETRKGKFERALNGNFNGSIPPFGYTLVVKSEATDSCPAGLHINPIQGAIVRRAFRKYSSGDYSDLMIAEWLNSLKYVKKIREGKKPFGKDTVRDMLQNHTYAGKIYHAPTEYVDGQLGGKKKSSRGRRTVHKGNHQAIVPEQMFNTCQEVRKANANHRRPQSKIHTNILQDLVFCARCYIGSIPDNGVRTHGKMGAKWVKNKQQGAFRCKARDKGYQNCGQKRVFTDTILQHVLETIKNIQLPGDIDTIVDNALRRDDEFKVAYNEIDTLRNEIHTINEMYRKGNVTTEYYDTETLQLRRNINSLYPIQRDLIIEAADLIRHFRIYWQDCATMENPKEAKRQLIAKIVHKVFIKDDKVIAIALHGTFSAIIGHDPIQIGEIGSMLSPQMQTSTQLSARVQSGSDGI